MKKFLACLCFFAISIYAKPVVTASILPTKYFVEQIAGDSVEVNVMVGSGADPHTYEPRPEQMKMVEKSDIFFAAGMDYERVWLSKLASNFPNMQIVQTGANVEYLPMSNHAHHENESEEEHAKHTHQKDEANAKFSLDPHIWLDPVLVKIQAKNIANALIAKYPQNRALYELNLAKFEVRLDELDSFAKEQLNGLENRNFIVYHPSWGYFAKRYNLVQIPIEVEGKEPKPKELANLISEAREEGVKVIFVSPQFSKKSALLIAKEAGAKVVSIDQLPSDWMSSMQETIRAFKESF